MGFPELFEKTIGSINFIPGIYWHLFILVWGGGGGGGSLLAPIHFRVARWPLYIFVFLVRVSVRKLYLTSDNVNSTTLALT